MPILSFQHVVVWSILFTVGIELVTILMRFVFGLQATRDTARTIGRATRGVRVHHGYVGAVTILLVAAGTLAAVPGIGQWLLVLGIGLLASDLIHHFAVLWPTVGSPEFHLVYPRVAVQPAPADELAEPAALVHAAISDDEPAHTHGRVWWGRHRRHRSPFAPAIWRRSAPGARQRLVTRWRRRSTAAEEHRR